MRWNVPDLRVLQASSGYLPPLAKHRPCHTPKWLFYLGVLPVSERAKWWFL